jgi:hypothetical protein
MAFQTGTASSFINLLDALRLFATANGWTQNQWTAVGADQWLSLQKGGIYANFLAEADNTDLWIMGALGYSGSAAWNAQPATMSQQPRMSTSLQGAIAWPVMYWFFQHSSPNSIEVVIRYQPTKYQWLMFGDITKYGTWIGGEYYAGAYSGRNSPTLVAFDTQQGNAQAPVLFHTSGPAGGSQQRYRGSNLHAEIDSNVWWSDAWNDVTSGNYVAASQHCWPLVNRSLSAFNGLMTLTPLELYAQRPDSHYSPLGRVEHVRYANVLNHNAADIIDIGGQKWMLFPWLEKGGSTDLNPTTLHAGMAIKYDGP